MMHCHQRVIYFLAMALFFDMICLFDLILYVPSTIFQLNRDGSSWVDPVSTKLG